MKILKPKITISPSVSAMLLPLLGYALFFRMTDETESQAASGAIIALAIACAILVVISYKIVKFGKILASREMRISAAFFLASVILPLISFFVLQTDAKPALQFSLEMAANALLFLVFYYSMRLGLISIKVVAICLACLGIYAGYTALSEFLQIQIGLRRLEGSVGKNLFGSATAASVLSCLYLASPAAKTSTPLRWIAVAGASVGVVFVILIGSRQALLALALATLIFSFFAYGFARISVLGLIFVVGVNVAFAALTDWIDLYHLQQRFVAANALGAGEHRLDIYVATLAEIDVGAFLFGRPDLYELWRVQSTQPHNLFLSSLRHVGVIPTLLLVSALLMTARKVRQSLQSPEEGVAVLTAGLYLLLAFFYVMLSGNMTRSFNFPIFWGLALGAADSASFVRQRKARAAP